MKYLGGSSMFTKLLKKDLSRDMRWMWVLFVATILVACLTRGIKEIGESIAFFKVIGIVFDSVFYSLAANVIIQPFLRSFFNFTKSFYSDESYLTHTLPVTKNQLITSKALTSLIEMTLGFMCLVVSLLVMYYSPTFFDTLKMLLSIVISGKFSLFLVLFLMIVLILIEFLMYISIIHLSIVIAYRAKEKRVLRAFGLTALFAFVAITILSVFMVAVLAINGVELTSATLVLPYKAIISGLVTGIVVYSLVSVVAHIFTKIEFSKGVNVD